MLAARLAIHRWGWLVAALIATVAALELRREPAPAVPPPAPAYAVLDHVPLRRATVGSSDAADPVPARPPRLTVRGERPFYFGHTVGGPSVLPPWLEPRHGDQPVLTFHGELDGSWIAIADATVILIDRDRHPEVGLDFDWFHMSAAPPESSDARTVVVEAHRVGPRLVVYGTDPRCGPFLASVDIATGRSEWVEQLNDATSAGFAVTRGYAITSEFDHDQPVLVARELGAGRVVASVPTQQGRYSLEAKADGKLHGVIEALAADGYTSEIDVDVD